MLDSAFKTISGASSESMRKNKIIECFKHIFTWQDCFAIPKPEEDDHQSVE